MNFRNRSCLALAALALLFADLAWACINDGSKPPAVPDISEAPLIRVTADDVWSTKKEMLSTRLQSLVENKVVADVDPNTQNSIAVTLIRLGRAAESIPVLEAMEKKWPGRYQTASNLGAAYEHTGQNELALKWVTEGLRRNPESHRGTEWLHVRILQAKLAREKDANWLATHSIYDGGAPLTGTAAEPTRARAFSDADGKPRTAKDVIDATAYQLNERMRFARPPEPLVAELLLELASVAALERGADVAMPVLALAAEYKPVRAELLEARRAHVEKMLQNLPRVAPPQRSPEPEPGSLVMILALIAAVVIFEIVRRTRVRQKRKAATV